MKLATTRLPDLAAAEKAIRAKLKENSRAASELAKLIADQTTLEATIADLDATTAWNDEAGVRNLDTKRGQLARLQDRIQTISDSNQPQADALNEALKGLQGILPYLLEPEIESLVDQASQAMLPFYGNRDTARARAQGCPMVNSFVAYHCRRWGEGIAPALEADMALKLIDALRDGKTLWVFPVQSIAAQLAA